MYTACFVVCMFVYLCALNIVKVKIIIILSTPDTKLEICRERLVNHLGSQYLTQTVHFLEIW